MFRWPARGHNTSLASQAKVTHYIVYLTESTSEENTSDDNITIRALDLNQDGKQDLRTYYDNKGSITREEIDGDFDGLVDIIDYYTNNVRTESQIDTNSDNTFDVFRFYEQEKLKREDLDINYDNKIDLTYTYDNDGKRIEE